MIVPLTHERMTVQRLPWATIAILALNVAAFLLTFPRAVQESRELVSLAEEIQTLRKEAAHPESSPRYRELADRFERASRERVFARLGFVPAEPGWSPLVSSMFIHAGWLHLIGNLYLLWLCGCSLEDLWGRGVYLGIYLAGGMAGALTHAWMFPESRAPLVGASGAIAGLMGAFLVRLYRTRIRFFYWYWIHFGTFHAPAGVMLILWLASQLFYAFVYEERSTVAFWAHVGGFGFGALAALFVKLTYVEEAFLAPAIEKKVTLFAQHPKVAEALRHFEQDAPEKAIPLLEGVVRESPEDVDALQLLGESSEAVGQPAKAAAAFRRKLRVHLRRREHDLAADAFRELERLGAAEQLSPTELLSIGRVLLETGSYADGVSLYDRLARSGGESIVRLKAAFALAQLYKDDDRPRQALEILEAVKPLARDLPEWSASIDERIAALRPG